MKQTVVVSFGGILHDYIYINIQSGRQTSKYRFLNMDKVGTFFPTVAMFHESGQTKKPCFLAMFPEGRQTRKHCLPDIFCKGTRTRKPCFLAKFPEDGQARKHHFPNIFCRKYAFLAMFPQGGQAMIPCFL